MERRPTIIYLHGGGFFGGSKSEGDPLAVGNPANQMLDDLVNRGFNLVNVEYALTPEGHFPIPLIQLNQAINFLKSHADDYNLDMRNVVIFGSSAGASLTIQYGTMLANPKYCKELDIYPKIEPANLKALIVDDVALFPENFNWALTVMLGNYMQTVDLQDRKLNELFNPCAWVNSNMSPVFLDAGTTDGFPQDMLRCGELLTELGVPNEVFIPDAELPHGFLNLINESSEAKRGYEHLTAFIEKYTK
jgi:acetyl esterase/lipase